MAKEWETHKLVSEEMTVRVATLTSKKEVLEKEKGTLLAEKTTLQESFEALKEKYASLKERLVGYADQVIARFKDSKAVEMFVSGSFAPAYDQGWEECRKVVLKKHERDIGNAVDNRDDISEDEEEEPLPEPETFGSSLGLSDAAPPVV